jgi:endonuclease-3 related protein
LPAGAVGRLGRELLLNVFDALSRAYGPQHWWPGETPFEVMLGAVLTQNTAWANVERALSALTARVPLCADSILRLAPNALADLLRPVGYFNVKTGRLRAFCAFYVQAGGFNGLARLETGELRRRLLDVHGVGPETADDMLLYAFERPVFVVDAYTRRVFLRLGELEGSEGYETIRAGFEHALGPDIPLFNEYHALIVRHGKDVCRTKPRCRECCLRSLCPHSVRGGPT